MEKATASKRNYGIDGLRMVSMLMIVILHSMGHGGVLKNLDPSSASYRIAWLIEAAAYCAVNCYAMISGYVGFRSRFKLSNLVLLWLQVTFYSVGITLLQAFTSNTPITVDMMLKAFTPVMSNTYWYFTAYCGMFFFTPLVNAAVEHMEKRQLQLALAGIVVLYSICVTMKGIDIFEISAGYHALWLIIVYAVGAYIGKYRPLQTWSKRRWLLVYMGSVLLPWGVHMLKNRFPDITSINLIQYTSPFILLAAFALLQLFSKLNVTGWVQKIIALFSAQSFGVYLIHDNNMIRKQLISGRLAHFASDGAIVMVVKVLLFALTIYIVCLLLDSVRHIVFQKLRIKAALERLEAKLIRK